jgi:hypothetical protein
MTSQLIINLSPIYNIIKVILTDNFNLIPIFSSVYFIVYYIFWGKFGSDLKYPDYYIKICCKIGILMSVLEIVVWVGYRHKVRGNWVEKNYDYLKKTETVETENNESDIKEKK